MSQLPDILHRAQHQAQVLGNLMRALELVDEAWTAHGADPELRFHLRRLAAWICRRLQPHHGSVELPRPLGELVQPRDAPAPHAGVEAALLDWDASGEAFLARLELVEEGDRPAPVGAAFQGALDRARRLVFRRLGQSGLRLDARRLAATTLGLGGPRAAGLYRADGASVAAGAAVVLHAAWTGSPVPDGVVITGTLGPDGAVGAVDGLEAKIAAALRERPGLRRLVVPPGAAGGDPRVCPVRDLDQLLELLFHEGGRPRLADELVDVEGTVRLGLELYEKQASFALALEVLRGALGAIEARRAAGGAELFRVEQFTALWRAGSCLIHLGDPDGAQALLTRARTLGQTLWERGELDPRAFLGFRGNLAVLLRDRFDFAGAEALLLENLEQQRALRQDRRELAKTRGNLGELYTFMGCFERAEELLTAALEALRAVYPDEVPRELCYLGNLHLRRGDPELALACFAEGLELNRGVTYGQARNAAFLRYGAVRACRELGRYEQVEQHASRGLELLPATELYPRQLILRERGRARLARGDDQAGERDLLAAADPTFARGALAALAAGTALGELCLVALERGQREQAQELGHSFRRAGGELFEAFCPDGLLGPLDRALEQGQGLAPVLRQVLDAFPY